MSALLCGEPYTRPGGETRLICQYLRGHVVPRHSWWTVEQQDLAEEAATIREIVRVATPNMPTDPTPTAVQTLLDGIVNGLYDPYLEAILAVGHNRKRARRGTIGFAGGTKGAMG